MAERVCRKCLLIREMSENLEEYLERYLSLITEDEQADDAQYEQRLSICKTCDKLLENMCQGCGCYVAFRAALREQKCPYQKW